MIREDFFHCLATLASWDPEFREQLTADPKAAIESYLKMELPDELKFHVHQDDANTLHVVLPFDGLNAAELVSAAGAGVCWSNLQNECSTYTG